MARNLADRSALQAPFLERTASNQKVVGVISTLLWNPKFVITSAQL